MEAKVNTTDLMNALGKIKNLAKEVKGNKIFANVHIEAADEGLTLTAMNNDAKAILKVPAVVKESDICLVDASKLYDITATFKGDIVLSSCPSTLYIKKDRAISQLPTVKPDAYPITLFEPKEINTSFTLPCKVLTDGLNKAVLFTDMRGFGIISGVNLALSKDEVCIVGCDGSRLVEIKNKIDNNTDLNITLPNQAINSLTTFLQNGESVTVDICGNLCVFKLGGNSYFTRIIEGKYPQVKQFLRENSETTYTVDKSGLKTILERIKISESPEDKSKVNLNPDGYLLHVSSPLDKVEDILVIEDKTGGDTPITLNRTFLTTVLTLTAGDRVKFGINNPHTGVMFNEDNTRICIMPIG